MLALLSCIWPVVALAASETILYQYHRNFW